MALVAVLDTSVLVPPSIRDTLLRCAERELYEPRWSPHIFDELRHTLTIKAAVPAARVDRLFQAMTDQFPAAMVDADQHLVPRMTNDPKDRHVLAAAVHAHASRIMTFNLKDFSTADLAPHGVIPQSPDDFLMDLARLSFDAVHTAIVKQAGALTRPPQSVGEVLATLARSAPTFARHMREQLLTDSL